MLLAVWSASAFVLEIPSGAWADLLDRRRLLVASGLIYAAAFATWLTWPTFWGFLLGFVLWSLSDALHSGTWEAYLFHQLSARGARASYARVEARAESVALLVMALAIAAAAPLHQLGGYALVGALSVTAALVHVGVTLALPRPVGRMPRDPAATPEPHPTSPRAVDPPVDGGLAGATSSRPGLRAWASTLRAGIAQAGATGPVRRVLVGYAAVVALVGVDEYFPLLLAADGWSVGGVAVVIAGIVLLEAVGTWQADRVARVVGTRHAALVLATGLLLAAGTWWSSWAAALALGCGYAVASSLYVAADARLQHAIDEDLGARATVTSVAGVVGEIGFLVTLGAVGIATLWFDLTVVVTCTTLVLTVPAALAARRMPAAPGEGIPAPDTGGAA